MPKKAKAPTPEAGPAAPPPADQPKPAPAPASPPPPNKPPTEAPPSAPEQPQNAAALAGKPPEVKEAVKKAPEGPDPLQNLSPEELEAQRQAFLGKFGWADSQPTPATPPVAPEAPEQPTEPAKTAEEEEPEQPETPPPVKKEDKPPEKPAEEPEKEEEETPLPGFDLDKSAEQAASRVADRLKPQPVQDKQPAQADGPKLSPARQRKLETLAYMEAHVPEYQGSGLRAQAQRLWSAEDAYRDNWKKANPGKSWDQASEDHNEFYENPSNQLHYSAEDYEDAHASLIEHREQEREKRHRQEIDDLRTSTEIDKQRGEVRQIVDQTVNELIAHAAPELKTFDKVSEQDPLLARQVARHAERVQVLVAEMENLARLSGKIAMDPDYRVRLSTGETIFPHAELSDFAVRVENSLLSLPADKTKTQDGRTLMKQTDYFDEIKKINDSKVSNAEKNRQIQSFTKGHWIVDADVVRVELARAAGYRARQETEEIRALAQKTGSSPAKPAPSKSQNGSPAPALSAPTPAGRAAPAAMTTPSDRTNATHDRTPQDVDRDRQIDQRMGW